MFNRVCDLLKKYIAHEPNWDNNPPKIVLTRSGFREFYEDPYIKTGGAFEVIYDFDHKNGFIIGNLFGLEVLINDDISKPPWCSDVVIIPSNTNDALLGNGKYLEGYGHEFAEVGWVIYKAPYPISEPQNLRAYSPKAQEHEINEEDFMAIIRLPVQKGINNGKNPALHY